MSINTLEEHELLIRCPKNLFNKSAYEGYKRDVTENYADILKSNSAIPEVARMTIEEITDNRYTLNFLNAELGVEISEVIDAILKETDEEFEIYFTTLVLDKNGIIQLEQRCKDKGYRLEEV